MRPDEWRESREIGVLDSSTLGLGLGYHFLHIDRIPVHDDVEQQAQRTEIPFLPLTQGAADFAAFTQEDATAETVAQFLSIQLSEDSTSKRWIVDVAQDVERLDDAPELGQGPREGGRIVLQALARYGKPEIFNTVQGSQFTCEVFTGVLVANKIAISMDGKGAWRDNVFVERIWKSIKYEEVYLYAYDSVGIARASIRALTEGRRTRLTSTRRSSRRRHESFRPRRPVAT